MNTAEASRVLDYLPGLRLSRLATSDEAGLMMVSLPWPASPARSLRLAGRPTHCQALGAWPGSAGAAPRRLLLTADGAGGAPTSIALTAGEATAVELPTARMVLIDRCDEAGFMWENHALELSHRGRTIHLALGLRHGDAVHWWEACGMEVLEDGPWCRTIKMAGAIPHTKVSGEEMLSVPYFDCPWLHRHNWLNGEIVVRLFGNGVVEVTARHINTKQVDEGRALDDCLPLIGLWGDGVAADARALAGDWAGTAEILRLGQATFDLSAASHLVSAAQPGRFDVDDADRLLWQPYQGVEIYGGRATAETTGDPWIVTAPQKRFPRGMARTVRFSLSLGDRSPRIVRYLAPAGWYGACREYHASAWLPVADELDARLQEAADWGAETMVRGGFEDGNLPRGSKIRGPRDPANRDEPSWEGDFPHALMLGAYRFGSAAHYDAALRSAYFVTDCVVDHADHLFRMHGFAFEPLAYALPMNRPMGAIAAWLETGDPYLLETAEAVTLAAHRIHLNSWPRLAVGRDSCYVRGAVALYRYCGTEYFRELAIKGCQTVAQVQRDDGSFGDQGGGSGLHQWAAYITKPWMGCLATSPLLDLLELEPDRPEHRDLAACVRRFGEWLLANRWERDGILGWSYQHAFKGEPRQYDYARQAWTDLRAPGQWHHDQLARILMWTTEQTGDPAYLAAWLRSIATKTPSGSDHEASATLMFQPYLQSARWRARLTAEGVATDPVHIGTGPATARILLPDDTYVEHSTTGT